MGAADMERAVRNLDHRVTRVEQILPTLATKEDLQSAIEPLATRAELEAAIEPLATRAEMRAAIEEAIEEAIEPLATKAELVELEQRMRTHFNVVMESIRDDIRLIVTGVANLSLRMDDLRSELKTDIAGLDRRLMRVEAGQVKH